MKKIAIMQPYFFPYLGYFQLINKADEFLLYGHVDFKRRSYITRNSLVNTKDIIEPINVKTYKSPLRTKINDIRVFDSHYQDNILKKVRNIYARSPYFEEVFSVLEKIIPPSTEYLMDYNSAALESTCKVLDIDTVFLPWKKLEKDFESIEHHLKSFNEEDNFKVSSKRVVDLCQYFDKTTYINPEGGTGIYDSSVLLKKGINLKFHKSDVSCHRNQSNASLRHASIIDVLMINGINRTKELVKMGKFI